MSYSVRNISKNFATSDYRELTPIERAVRLVLEHKASLRKAALCCGVTASSLNRAVNARKEGRDIGINGRPPSLEPAEMLVLANELSNRVDSDETLDFGKARNIVSIN